MPVSPLRRVPPSRASDLNEAALGSRVLGNGASDNNGGRILEMVRAARSRDSLSDDLGNMAESPEEKYHVDFSRANILRALNIPPDAAVLEIGAECGALTRHVGEVARIVDALEADKDKAAAGTQRVGDLSNTRFIVGQLSDLPPIETYDAIIAVGDLEYPGTGTTQDPALKEFMDDAAIRLKPGGALVLAFDNAVGAKHLGMPSQSHAGAFVDSGKTSQGPEERQTFSHQEVEEMARRSGLETLSLGVFPDHRFSRVVFNPSNFEPQERDLLKRLPRFPNQNWQSTSSFPFNEERAWGRLVDANVVDQHANSLLIIATKGEPSARLWPEDRAAVYFSQDRMARFTTKTTVSRDERHELVFDRVPLVPGYTSHGISVRPLREQRISGQQFNEVFVGPSESRSAELLRAWANLVRETDPKFAIDAMPGNVIVDDSGDLRLIDLEWVCDSTDHERALRRGSLLLAHSTQGPIDPSAWEGVTTVRDAAVLIGQAVGLDRHGGWVETAVEEEVGFLRQVIQVHPSQGRDRVDEHHMNAWQMALSRSLIEDEVRTGNQVPAEAQEERDAREDAEVAGLRRSLANAVHTARYVEAERDQLEALLAEATDALINSESAAAEMISRMHANFEPVIEQARADTVRMQALLEHFHELGIAGNAYRLAWEDSSSQIGRIESELAAVKAELSAHRETITWRLGAPLRALRRWTL